MNNFLMVIQAIISQNYKLLHKIIKLDLLKKIRDIFYEIRD